MHARANRERMVAAKIPGEETGIEIRKTVCSICNPQSHCGIDAYIKDGAIIRVEGSKEHPHNQGTLCSKGSASRQYIYHKDRIRTPLRRTGKRGAGQFEPVSWDDALGVISERLLEIKKESGPESVAFFAGYTKWMRPFLKRLAHSFGSPNYMTESSTCHYATVLATKLNYGGFGIPDVKNTRCLLVWSRNPFYSNTAIVRGLLDARERGMKIIEVGPLLTPMTAHADIHLRMRPGTSGALALGLAHVIIEEDLYDRDFVEKWTLGFEEYRAYVKGFTPRETEKITGVSADLIVQAARLYAGSKPSALMTSASPTVHHTNGVQNHRALTALVGLTGNFDQPGGNHAVPTGWIHVANGLRTRQPEFEQSRPWTKMAPRIGQDRFPVWCRLAAEAQAMHLPFQIQSKRPYPVRAVLAFGMRASMWPGSDFMVENLKKLDFFVDVDLFMTETAKLADIVLPACSSFERSELKFYPQKYVIWTRPVIDPLWESRSDADIIFDLARRLAPRDLLMKSGYEACMDWILDPANLTVAGLKEYPGGCSVPNATMPPYRKYEKSGFNTPSGKMEFHSMILEEAGLDPLPVFREPKLGPHSKEGRKYPLILTTGARLPMYVHSRTFRMDQTRGLRPEPFLDINPKDAGQRAIGQDDWVSLETSRNSLRVRANVTEIVPPGVINFYHAWPEADANLLIEPDYLDPISGYPGFKSLLCDVKKIEEMKPL